MLKSVVVLEMLGGVEEVVRAKEARVAEEVGGAE